MSFDRVFLATLLLFPVFAFSAGAVTVTEVVAEKTDSSVTLVVSGEDVYSIGRVSCVLASDGSSPCASSFSGTILDFVKFVAAGLSPATGYTFDLEVVFSGGTTTNKIVTACTKPSAPANFNQISANASTVTAEWLPNSPAPDTFSVYNGDVKVADLPSTAIQYTYSDPFAGSAKSGTCKISAAKTVAECLGEGALTSEKAEIPCSTAPSEPLLEVTTRTRNVMDISAGVHPSDELASPPVNLTLIRNDTNQVDLSNPWDNVNLTPGYLYSYVLTATYNGYSTSAPAQVQCTKPDKVTSLDIKRITETTIEISWLQNFGYDYWDLSIYPDDATPPKTTIYKSDEIAEHTFTALRADFLYSISIVTYSYWCDSGPYTIEVRTSTAEVEEKVEYTVTDQDVSTRSVTLKVDIGDSVQLTTNDFEDIYLFAEPVVCPEGAVCENYQSDVEGPGVVEYEMKGLIPAARYEYKFYLRNLATGNVVTESTSGNKEIVVKFCTKPGLPNVENYEGRLYSLNGKFSECVTVEMVPENENVKYVYTVTGGNFNVEKKQLSNDFTHCTLVDQKRELAIISVQLVLDCEDDEIGGDVSTFDVTEFVDLNDGFDSGPVSPVDVTMVTGEWLSKSIARVTWQTSDESHQSHDYFLVWLNLKVVANGTLDEKSFTIDQLDLCKNYFVRVEAFFRDKPGQSYEIVIRNWDDPNSMKQILDKYPTALVECGKCSNVEKTKLCSFPFNWENVEYRTCTAKMSPESGQKQLGCMTSRDEKISCAANVPQCLPPEPTLSGLSISTIAVGFVSVNWEVSSDELGFYKIFLNGEEIESTTDSGYNLTNLEIGTKYEFEVRVDSFGRVGEPERISFVSSNKTENAFALNQTSESADIIWDAPKNDGNQSGNAGTQIAIMVEERPLLTLLLGEERLKDLQKQIHVTGQKTKASLGDLVPGVKYSVTVIKTVEGASDTTALETAVTTVPHPLEEEQNDLRLEVNNTQGIKLTGRITASTYSEKLNFVFVVVEVHAEIATDGEFSYIATVEEQQKSSSEDECLTEEQCVTSGSINFKRQAFTGTLDPGLVYLVKTTPQTGSALAKKAAEMLHLEKPLPVTDLRSYHVTSEEIRFFWGPPTRGQFVGFIVEYHDSSGNFISEEIGGFLRYFAQDLQPGYTYTFEVYAFTHIPDQVHHQMKSDVIQLKQDTAPLPPESVDSTHLFSTEHPNEFSINVEPPMSGQWDRFEVTYDDLYSPVGEKVATFAPNSLTGDIQFDRFGVVYTLEVRSVSTNGVKSLSEIEHKLVTEPDKIEDVEVVVKNDYDLCLHWQLSKDNGFYSKVKSTAEQNSVEIDSNIFDITDEQTSGVVCLNISKASKASALSTSFQVTVEYPNDFSQPISSVPSFPLNVDLRDADTDYSVTVDAKCEPGKCDITITDNGKLPRKDLQYRIELVSKASQNRRRRNTGETNEFNGSECQEESENTCTFTMDNLSTGSYDISVWISFFGVQIFPNSKDFNVKLVGPIVVPGGGGEGSNVGLWVYVLAGGGILVIVLALAIVMWARTKKIPKQEENGEETTNQRHSGEYDNLNTDSLDGPYDELNKEKDEYADLNGDYIEGVEAEMDYQHPNYATHIYEKTMQVANEISRKAEYEEATTLNRPIGGSRDTNQVDVQIGGGTAGQLGQHQADMDDPRYV